MTTFAETLKNLNRRPNIETCMSILESEDTRLTEPWNSYRPEDSKYTYTVREGVCHILITFDSDAERCFDHCTKFLNNPTLYAPTPWLRGVMIARQISCLLELGRLKEAAELAATISDDGAFLKLINPLNRDSTGVNMAELHRAQARVYYRHAVFHFRNNNVETAKTFVDILEKRSSEDKFFKEYHTRVIKADPRTPRKERPRDEEPLAKSPASAAREDRALKRTASYEPVGQKLFMSRISKVAKMADHPPSVHSHDDSGSSSSCTDEKPRKKPRLEESMVITHAAIDPIHNSTTVNRLDVTNIIEAVNSIDITERLLGIYGVVVLILLVAAKI